MRLIDEKKLLERDPIIAPDGYIPNSVIRRKLKPPKHEPPVRLERRWKLKPVPKADPKYMPKGWGAAEKEKEKTPPPRLVVRKWADTPTPEASDRSVASSLSSVSIKSTPPTPPRLLKKFIRECHAKPKSESKSAKTRAEQSKLRENTQASTMTLTPFLENKTPTGANKYSRENSLSERVIHWTPSPKLGSAAARGCPSANSPEETHFNIESQSPSNQMRSKQTDSEMEELRRKRKSALDREKLAGMTVEEETSDDKMKKQKGIMESELIRRLLDEKWMPIVDSSADYVNILAKLLRLLDDHNPMVYNSVIDYLIALFKELGIIEEMLDKLIAKLGANLDILNTAIKRHTLRGLQVVGTGRTDVLRLILPKLIDEEEAVRKAAAEAILVLTGAKDKETLFQFLDTHGVTAGIYSSKEDEEFAFRVLAERLAEGAEDPAYFDRLEARIMDWVERTTPGLISEDMNPEDLEQLWKNGSQSRKSSMYKSREQSFMSEKSGRMTSGMTMYADLPATPGFSSELSELCLSRGVSKSGELKSAASRYNARMGLMDLMDRSGAVNVPGERWEPPTPVTCSESSEHDPTPSIVDDPLLLLQMEKSNLTNLTNDSRCSKQSFDNIKITEERTLTNLSQVGPLPSFMRRDNSDRKSYDAISTDSAIESGFSASEYEGMSHFSEMLTFSHTDQQSFKDSVLSETNEILDAEHDSEEEIDAGVTEVADDTLKGEADGNIDDDTEIEGKLLEIYFDENLESIVEVVEEVILTPVPGVEGLSLLVEEDEEEDKMSSDEMTPRAGPDIMGLGSLESESRGADTRSTVGQRLHEDGSTISGGTMSSQGSRACERFTPRDAHFYRVFDREPKPGSSSNGEEKEGNQAEAGTKIMERLSGQDSGISQDMSELSQKGKVHPHGASLSPVKSEGSIATEKQHQQPETMDKDWRKFFELPTAIERHQMELIKHELAQGKLKPTQLPPISYFARDLPMLPGEAGTRLLQTVRVGEKGESLGDGRHRIEPVPGKLAVHTKNESEGSSCFGIIQMEWTTGVPTMKDHTQPPQRLPRYRLISEDTSQYLPPLQTRLSQLSHLDRMRLGTSDTDLHLPNLATASTTPTVSQHLSPTASHRLSPSFEWELPLPPPPAKESRTVIPYIKKEHDSYCKYYQLVKKKLHLYTSHLGFIPALIAAEKARPPPKKQRERSLSLPTVITKSMASNRLNDGPRLTHQSRDTSNLVLGTEQQLLPPIKLGQLINISN